MLLKKVKLKRNTATKNETIANIKNETIDCVTELLGYDGDSIKCEKCRSQFRCVMTNKFKGNNKILSRSFSFVVYRCKEPKKIYMQ